MKKLLLNFFSFILKRLIKIAPPAVVNENKELFLSKIDSYNNAFNSIITRPKYAEQLDRNKEIIPANKRTAIVLQGPVVHKDNFTVETVKIYKKHYPDHLIIISTWNDLDSITKSKLEELEVELILNEKPEKNGSLNINLQITSSKNGILKAKEAGCDFVYKTRADQRFYAINLTSYLISMISNQRNTDIQVKYKLVTASMTTLKYRPYGVGDMFMFGSVGDMLLYWDSVLDQRDLNRNDIPKLSVSETARLKLAETYLCTNFLDKIGYPYDFTLQDSWNVYSNYFQIIDFEMINLFWYKYNWRNESRFDYSKSHTYSLLNTISFHGIANNEYKIPKESDLNQPEGGEL